MHLQPRKRYTAKPSGKYHGTFSSKREKIYDYTRERKKVVVKVNMTRKSNENRKVKRTKSKVGVHFTIRKRNERTSFKSERLKKKNEENNTRSPEPSWGQRGK